MRRGIAGQTEVDYVPGRRIPEPPRVIGYPGGDPDGIVGHCQRRNQPLPPHGPKPLDPYEDRRPSGRRDDALGMHALIAGPSVTTVGNARPAADAGDLARPSRTSGSGL